ncbi:MAG: M20 family metallopeptidase [Chloracidobacterium sp.]|uniref:Amidohydrolase n=1 Tax=Chloracidobacterium validum TaxID=2821543 RepID=A0ABX8B8P9_9BACT|nr:M20 family metallopeptidase [Chloracidobacterium validum]QUW02054.1 amidohydrolase [Chloracidobacterium validum]
MTPPYSVSAAVLARDARYQRDIADLTPKLIETRRDLHQHPELSNREERTARVVADRLRALGLEVTTGIAHHGVIGVLRGGKPGKVIALRADMDALPIEETRDTPYTSRTPGVMHACGHDVHTTVALGVAEVLSKYRADLPGTVKFIFQPAEEGPPRGERGGAKMMLEEGAFDAPTPDAIFGLHCMPTIEAGSIGYCETSAMASADRFLITVRGKKVHGAYPHEGIDAIVTAATVIEQLQTIRSRRIDTQLPLVLSIGSIHGGNRFNILADEVRMEGTVRTLDPDVHARVEPLMRQILKGVTESHGASYELDYERIVPVTVNHAPLVAQMLPTIRRIVGDAHVLATRPQMGAEDFSYFANRVPAFFYFLGVGNKAKGLTAMLHTPDFDVDEACLPVGVSVMAAMATDWLEAAARQS